MTAIIGLLLLLAVVWLLMTKSSLLSKLTAGSDSGQVMRLGGGDGTFGMEVVGESHYLAALRSIAGRGEVRHECTALLRLEDENPFDDCAVAVYIEDRKVGYLRRFNARQYRTQVGKYGKLDGVCPAVIIGGGEGRPNLGVWLDLPTI